MKNPAHALCVAALCALSATGPATAVAGVEIVSCRSGDGRISYHQSCPPGTVKVESRSFRRDSPSDPNASIRATVYAIPDCDSCVEVKEFLATHNIAYDEKLVHEDVAMQDELRELAGSLSAPTTVIGKEIIRGYSREKLMSALLASGYVAPTPESP